MRVALLGTGMWAPGWPDGPAWMDRRHDAAATQPAPGLLPPATARRSTFLARMAADTLAQALHGTGLDPAGLGLVLGTGGGELQTTFECLDLLHQEPPSSSPLRFRNSVHNAALGHLSIALGARGYASALAADPDRLLAMALLEGMARVAVHGEACAVVVADETWPGFDFDPLAVAFLLAPEGTPGARGTFLSLAREPRTAAPPAAVPERLLGNPAVQALDLLAAVHLSAEAEVAVSRGTAEERPWVLRWRRSAA